MIELSRTISLEEAEFELQKRNQIYNSSISLGEFKSAADALIQRVYYETLIVLLKQGLNVYVGDEVPDRPGADISPWEGHRLARAKDVLSTIGMVQDLMQQMSSMSPEDRSGLLFLLGATLGDVYAGFDAAASGRSDRYDELLAYKAQAVEQRKRAAQSKAEADRLSRKATDERALEIARNARKVDPTLSQEDVADKIKDELKSLVPKNSSIEVWVRRWEKAGALNKKNKRVP